MNREGERERGIDGKVTGHYLFTGYGRDTQLRMPRKPAGGPKSSSFVSSGISQSMRKL
jgi:hypothetical protein